MNSSSNYGDQICELLSSLDYTHCFFVAGGNIMHILNSANKRFTCIPVVHEMSAGIAAEYFNEANRDSNAKAFALVTAGPGLTNIITAMAGAYLESRELLVIGGQVKSEDLKQGVLRQNGIQEIDGLSLAKSVTTSTLQIAKPIELDHVEKFLLSNEKQRKGPLFLEFCLDAQAHPRVPEKRQPPTKNDLETMRDFSDFFHQIHKYRRPVLLIGGGVSRKFTLEKAAELQNITFPIMTTWNAADRIDSKNDNYFGRPNTWGQRSANVILQQADLIVAVGTRLGLQQTGFNWRQFGSLADIVHVDLDDSELNRDNLQTSYKFKADADLFLGKFLDECRDFNAKDWLNFAQSVKQILPLSEPGNLNFEGFWNPYDFVLELSKILEDGDSIVPSSSGAAETVAMQALQQVKWNTVITNKGLASMGYGLAGAIGVAVKTGNRVFHLEGDGGFAQNLQELGTVAKNNLPIKTFIFVNSGYASIRMTQKSYFNGNYIGCDDSTGLGLPVWEKIFDAYQIPAMTLSPEEGFSEEVLQRLNSVEPQAFLIPIHPEQTYFPKITSSINERGNMVSNPLHLMSPPLDSEVAKKVFQYLTV
jgi:acetolactate synthase-1/2/3 large subunit